MFLMVYTSKEISYILKKAYELQPIGISTDLSNLDVCTCAFYCNVTT